MCAKNPKPLTERFTKGREKLINFRGKNTINGISGTDHDQLLFHLFIPRFVFQFNGKKIRFELLQDLPLILVCGLILQLELVCINGFVKSDQADNISLW